MYEYVKALHIIFIVTWFSGLFYIVRLFIYNTEAGALPDRDRDLLRLQFRIMMRRLWFGITWPSAILTLIFGTWMVILLGAFPQWLIVKLVFVAGLYAYHFSIHHMYKQQVRGIFRHSSYRLRIWNEVATIFLVCIVMIVVVKQSLSWLWALGGLLLFMAALFSAIRIYRAIRNRQQIKKSP